MDTPSQTFRLIAIDLDGTLAEPDGVISARPRDAIARTQARGVRVPDDISIVGYDGIDVTRFLTPPLTTIEQPRRLMGQRAMEILLHLLRDEPIWAEQTVTLAPQLVVRQSTAPPREYRR